jgi:nucleoside-diphosphate-sugar epimerase
MRVLLAGATGAVGTPLTRKLIEAGHEVIGVSRHPGRLRELGATPVEADVLDRGGLLRALDGMAADAVVHQLTALRRTPMRHRDMAGTNVLRVTGTANLLAAARQLGAARFVTQSIVFGYGFRDHGDRTLTEDDPFGVPVGNRLDEHLAAMVATERQALELGGVALRYGGFYGPGAGTEQQVTMLRRRAFPVLAGGGGFLPWIHIEDAASAAVAALERGRPGRVYNIVDDTPTRLGDCLDTLAEAYRAPRPIRVPAGLFRIMPYAHAFLTLSMKVGNARAREELDWSPAFASYRDGIAALAGGTR